MSPFLIILLAALAVICLAAVVVTLRNRADRRARNLLWIPRELQLLESRSAECERKGRIDRGQAACLVDSERLYYLATNGRLAEVAEEIADQFGLLFKEITVSYCENLQERARSEAGLAGLVEISDSWDGVSANVLVNDRYVGFEEDTVAVLAHEISHVWLTTLDANTRGLLNEKRTDLGVYLCGLGRVALNGMDWNSRMGYLTPREMEYAYRWVCQRDSIQFSEAEDGLGQAARAFLRKHKRSWNSQT